jgi:hypothetical protein
MEGKWQWLYTASNARHTHLYLSGRDVLGGGQPCGLAAAKARARRPPQAGGGPIKYHQLAFSNSLHQTGIIRARETGRGSPAHGSASLESIFGYTAHDCLNFLASVVVCYVVLTFGR